MGTTVIFYGPKNGGRLSTGLSKPLSPSQKEGARKDTTPPPLASPTENKTTTNTSSFETTNTSSFDTWTYSDWPSSSPVLPARVQKINKTNNNNVTASGEDIRKQLEMVLKTEMRKQISGEEGDTEVIEAVINMDEESSVDSTPWVILQVDLLVDNRTLLHVL